jgi:hypothetical protein
MGGTVPMTIEHIHEDHLASCVWFTDDCQLCRENFILKTLRLADDDEIRRYW